MKLFSCQLCRTSTANLSRICKQCLAENRLEKIMDGKLPPIMEDDSDDLDFDFGACVAVLGSARTRGRKRVTA